ncbi:hypothetical protein GGI25_006247 [Coemansia spiralis]|uniref:pantothenate kinase n=2 Tax=Coemansia TaxID=4863 RepID=A0A9W8KVD3_9FUNG|nr:fumble-domain-containing protein [Coemansia spiralis]KAJ1992036.1 hypothetical protein EDC05_003027 [Coemansia umbellata]KAJ2621460.1 hypothetical protein GGI26_004142 [Coemansia sp. RSA 1358]KAJ2669137.1 hypothetical protein GGI25_006247 [Coemansia spiralis]
MMFGNINSSGATIDDIERDTANDILLPNQLGRVQKVAVDIGGTLAKVVYLTTTPENQGGRLHFTAFNTDNIDKCLVFIRSLLQPDADAVVVATGGGAHRFREQLQRELGVAIRIEDEMASLTTGLNFLMREVADEVFAYSEDQPMRFVGAVDDIFPYMLVNIGSGVSIIKVTREGEFERISGTSLGGGTLWGLLHLLTGEQSFDQMLEMTKAGDNTRVDLMVGDIYGTNYDKIGLKATNIAATMAGVYRESLDKRYGDADIARSLLYMVSNNIGQIAYLNAQLHGIRHIYFGGYFIRGHPLTMHTLSYAINFWSKGAMRALFLRHEGFLGATGAFFINEPTRPRTRAYSFTENFSITETIDRVSSLGMLDRQPAKLLMLPQLVSTRDAPYRPDTVDLSKDAAQQEYWIAAMERNTRGLLELADTGALENGEGARRKMASFVALYLRHLRRLRERPLAYGPMSVRALLGLREQCLHEVGLEDIFGPVKQRETEAALAMLPQVLAQTDGAQTEALLHNVLAGNMFDWGASDLRDLLAAGALGFAQAQDKITYGKLDNAHEFARVLEHKQYRRAVVFVDNSGADVCLGVLPFARHLLKRSTSVVLAANSRPALNDVTEPELVDIVERVSALDKTVGEATRSGRLLVCGTGSSGPCLDLRKLDERLVVQCEGVDLVVLVGMGRAIHSNYHARFACDSLKLAVFKNKMAADAANASIYDALCLFVPA